MITRRGLLGLVGAAVAVAMRPARAVIGLLGGAVPATGGGSGFFADPYSAYTSNYIADTTYMGTPGATTSVSWNGGMVSGPTYSTAQAAISAAASHLVSTSNTTRVCLLAGQTYTNVNTPLYIPSDTGTVATSGSPFVIQGDPAASATTMPIVTGSGGQEGGFAIGSAPSGSLYSGSNDNRNTVIRKIEITNFVSAGGANAAIYGVALGTNGTGKYSGTIVAYCKLHLFRYSSTAGEGGSGPVYTFNPNTSDIFQITYSKLYDSLGTDGTTDNSPFAAVETYGGVFEIDHCEVYACPTFFSGKVLTPTTPNGSLHHNLIHDCGNNGSGIIEGEAGGEGPGYNGLSVYNNLFYWTGAYDSLYGPASAQSVWNDTGANGNTTQPTNVSFYNNTIVAAIGSSSSFTLWNHFTTNFSLNNNVMLGSVPLSVASYGDGGTFSTCDYNVYFNPATFYLAFGSTPDHVSGFTAWQGAHTTYPSFTGLTANPDAHGIDINALSASWNTIADNFPGYASYNYAIAAGSPLKGAGQGGADPGYDPTNCGPGW